MPRCKTEPTAVANNLVRLVLLGQLLIKNLLATQDSRVEFPAGSHLRNLAPFCLLSSANTSQALKLRTMALCVNAAAARRIFCR